MYRSEGTKKCWSGQQPACLFLSLTSKITKVLWKRREEKQEIQRLKAEKNERLKQRLRERKQEARDKVLGFREGKRLDFLYLSARTEFCNWAVKPNPQTHEHPRSLEMHNPMFPWSSSAIQTDSARLQFMA